jgi:P4 family phage/plasmid primase-like protien
MTETQSSQQILEPRFENIPQSLRERPQWLLWKQETRDGDTTKVPYQPNGSHARSNDSATWCSFEEARSAFESGGFDGIGFVFTPTDPVVGIDLDNAVSDGDLTGGAWDVVKRLDSYTEGSPSGTGLHVICEGTLPDYDATTGKKTTDVVGMKEIEVYDRGRYFTFTGRHLDSAPSTVEGRESEIHALCKDKFGDPSPDPEPNTSAPSTPSNLSDRELIEKAKNADDGGTFSRLWSGDTSGHGGDHSRADLALVNELAFWTRGDRRRIDQLFRDSGLCRDKWTDRADYRKRTIDEALDGRTEFYEPDSPSSGSPSSGSPSSRSSGMGPRGDGQKGTEPEPPSDDLDGWDAVRAVYEDNKAEARVVAAETAIEDLHFATREETGQLYYFDSEDKVYDSGGAQALRTLLVEELGPKHSRHEENEIRSKIEAKTYRSGFGGEFVPVANGDLFVEESSVELEDVEPERAPFYRSKAPWDPSADCPRFAAHLHEVVPTQQERETLQEYVGYCLLHWDIPHHKALFMVGPTASGKSTTLAVIRKLLGQTSNVSPQQLVNERFGAAELEGSWANIRSDINNAVLRDIGKFKEIVGGDPIYVERKFEQGYAIRPTAKHLYSANQLPEASVDDAAFYRRILLVSFPETIPEEEQQNRSELDAALESELDGILRWAVQGLQRVMKQNGFTHDLSPQETQRRWSEHSSSIGRFKAAALEITGDESDVAAKQDVFSAYTAYCDEQGLSTETQVNLTRTLKEDSRITDADRTPEHHDSQTSCYVGLKLRENHNPQLEGVPF